ARPVMTLALMGLLAACGSAAPAPTTHATPSPAGLPTSPVATSGGPSAGSVMQVNIRSGKDTGSHYAFSAAATCTYGQAADGADKADSWGNVYSGGSDDLSALAI